MTALDRAYHRWLRSSARSSRCQRCGTFRIRTSRAARRKGLANELFLTPSGVCVSNAVPECEAWKRAA